MAIKVWFYLHAEQMRPKREKNITFSLSYCDKFLNKFPEISLAVQWLRLHFPVEGVQVQSLVRELRSHMPLGQKKNKT